MASKLSIRKNGNTRRYVGGEIIKVDGSQVREIYVRKSNTKTLVWQYDISAPTIQMIVPSSDSAANPNLTYANSILVSAIITDSESGLDTSSVKVNGSPVVVTNNSISHRVDLKADDLNIIKIEATDKAGNTRVVESYVRQISNSSRTDLLLDKTVKAVSSYGTYVLTNTYNKVGDAYAARATNSAGGTSVSQWCQIKIPNGVKTIQLTAYNSGMETWSGGSAQLCGTPAMRIYDKTTGEYLVDYPAGTLATTPSRSITYNISKELSFGHELYAQALASASSTLRGAAPVPEQGWVAVTTGDASGGFSVANATYYDADF